MRSPNAVSLSIEEGTHFPLSMTTSGRVLLSMFSKEKRKEILSRDTYFKKWNKTERQKLFDSIEKASTKGYRSAKSKLTSGVTDIAVPIGMNNSELTAVLAVSIFSSSLEELDIEEIITELIKTQQKINQFIGG